MKKGPNSKKMLTTSPEILIRLGVFIKRARLDTGISRTQICSALDISNSQLSAWENGKAEPRFCHLIRLCALYRVSFNQILEIYGVNAGAPETGDLITKYNALHEESRLAITSIIDAMLISDILRSSNKKPTVPIPINENHPIIEEPDKKSRVKGNTSVPDKDNAPTLVKRGRGRPRKKDACFSDVAMSEERRSDCETTQKNHKRGRPRKTSV